MTEGGDGSAGQLGTSGVEVVAQAPTLNAQAISIKRGSDFTFLGSIESLRYKGLAALLDAPGFSIEGRELFGLFELFGGPLGTDNSLARAVGCEVGEGQASGKGYGSPHAPVQEGGHCQAPVFIWSEMRFARSGVCFAQVDSSIPTAAPS